MIPWLKPTRMMAATLTIIPLCLFVSAPGQEPSKEPAKTTAKSVPAAVTEMQVIALQHASANHLSQVLASSFGKDTRIRIVAEPQSNSIVVQAARAEMDLVRELVKQFDKRPAAVPEVMRNRLSILPLRTIVPDQAFEAALKLALDGYPYAIDRARKAVIINTDEDTRLRVESMVTRLESESTPRPPKDVQVRVVWILDDVPDMNRKSSMPPPSDMSEVLPALAKMGMTKPGLAGQLLVTATTDREFRVHGNTNVWNIKEDVRFSATGSFAEKKSGSELIISIRGQFEGGKSELFALNSSINIPLGQFVVLGMTPFQHATSAFVVQVVPKP